MRRRSRGVCLARVSAEILFRDRLQPLRHRRRGPEQLARDLQGTFDDHAVFRRDLEPEAIPWLLGRAGLRLELHHRRLERPNRLGSRPCHPRRLGFTASHWEHGFRLPHRHLAGAHGGAKQRPVA